MNNIFATEHADSVKCAANLIPERTVKVCRNSCESLFVFTPAAGL